MPIEPGSGSIKCDIIHHLAKSLRYSSYLEICTATTGNYFSRIDSARFDHCRRLMYRCPPDFDDGANIDFRCPADDIAPALAQVKASAVPADICLVDGWHVYETARRDIEAAYDLLAEGGALVVHDCLPPRKDVASPAFRPEEWCGVSYQAFLDFVLGRKGMSYFTVDADYGCGIIFKHRRLPALIGQGGGLFRLLFQPWLDRPLIRQWREAESDDDRRFAYLQENKTRLLKLVSLREFWQAFEA